MKKLDQTGSQHRAGNYIFLFENTSDAVFIIDDFHIRDCNRSALRLFSCEKKDLSGKSITDISPEYQTKESLSSDLCPTHFIAPVIGEHKRFHWTFRLDNHKELSCNILLSGIEINGNFFLQAIINKIPGNRELAPHPDKEGYLADLILNIFPGLFFIYDITEGIEKAKLIRFNRKWYTEKLGFGPDDVPQDYPDFFFSHDESARMKELMQDLVRYKYLDFELNTLHKGGYSIPYLYVANIYKAKDHTYFIGSGIDISERKYVESALKQSEQYFKNIFDSSTDAIIVMDPDYKLLNANRAFFKMFGYKFEEVVFQNILEILPKSTQAVFSERLSLLKTEIPQPPVEIEAPKRTGEMIPVEVSSIIIHYGDREGILSTIRDLTERKSYEKRIFNSEIYSEERERERFAKELHDGLGPILSTCKIYLHSLNEMLNEDKDQLKISNRAVSLLDDALASIKEISNNLSPHILRNFGLVQAVISFTHNLESVANLKFRIHYNFEKRLDEVIEFTVYRIVTELINNTLKYAEAKLVIIEIYLIQSELKVIYSDDGKGFDFKGIKKQNKGFGLMNIENRISKFHGSFSFMTEPGKGFMLEFSLDTTRDPS
jgi:PAS domain S-box-containing protein